MFLTCTYACVDYEKCLSVLYQFHKQKIHAYSFKMTSHSRQVLFYARVMFWKMSHKSKTKFPFKTVYFLGVRGLTTSSNIVNDYTTSVHTDV